MIAGFEVPAQVTSDSVLVRLPDGLGDFRGARHTRPDRVEGFWVQPAGLVAGVPYATPVALHRSGMGSWQGRIVPAEDRYALYLSVRSDSSGRTVATFRNPERNSRGGAPEFQVVRTGDLVRFSDSASGTSAIVATYDSAGPRLTLSWPPLGAVLTLTPRSRENSVGLFPRTPAPSGYQYRVPLDQGDGWTVGRAGTAGFDESVLTRFVSQVISTDPLARAAPLIHSVLIARQGKLVLEEYFFGYDRTRTHDLRSASKTFTSIMLGAAMQHGVSLGPESRVYRLFHRYDRFSRPDPRKQQITLGHLLTHTSGLACDDSDPGSPGNEGTMQTQTEQPDWIKYTLDLGMAHDPGAAYAYCSGGMNLVGGTVAVASGLWLPELFERWIARPLDIMDYHVNLTPTGEAYSGGGVQMRPRDFLKFGQLFLDHGLWRGQRIVPDQWVRQSTTRQVRASPDNDDGFGWHLFHLQVGTRQYREYEANGNGGQLLIVVPELDLAVVFTAGNYNNYGVWRKFRDELVPEVIIPAIRRR
ncbi:MAG TPA: serine hydrolase domain-containing protein [Gemmatimonadales bacterium]|nr:serine hydrolase domain-containing protein [Gemmatimonadales bacterium]